MAVNYDDYEIEPSLERFLGLIGAVVTIPACPEPTSKAALALKFVTDPRDDGSGPLSGDEIQALAVRQAQRDPDELDFEREQNIGSNMLTAFAFAALAIAAGAEASAATHPRSSSAHCND